MAEDSHEMSYSIWFDVLCESCLAEDSPELSSLIFSEKQRKNIQDCCSIQGNMITGIRIE